MAIPGLPETADVAVVSWREQWPGYTLSTSSVQGSESVLREIWDKAPSYSVHRDKHMRGRVLEGLWFGSCKFIPIICLQLRPVCTVCLQSGAINVIVRGCSWLKCLSYFSLPGFKWALAGFVSQCFSFPNVNASLDLYQPLYTLPFLSFSFFLDQIQTTRAPFQSGTSAQIYVSSVVHLEGKSVHIQGDVKSRRTHK